LASASLDNTVLIWWLQKKMFSSENYWVISNGAKGVCMGDPTRHLLATKSENKKNYHLENKKKWKSVKNHL
jgi:hypothetical protein